MENLQFLWQGFQVALTMPNLVSALVGAILGLIVGAVPGIGSLAGVALLLPLTFRMNPTTAIIALATLYYSNMYGGAFSAILLNIPGDSPAVMTALDGYPLARSGKAGLALSTSIVSSFIGGTLGIIILTISGPLLARWGLNFGPGELTLLIMFAMTSIGWLLGENPSTGLVATGMGLMFATVGVDMAMGLPRFDFGSVHLLSGVPFIPLVIGMFGFSQVIDMVVNKEKYVSVGVHEVSFRDSMLKGTELKRILPVNLRQGVLGTIVGVMPGAGATAASFLSYIMEKRINKNRDNIGKGAIEGIAAAEASNNGAAMGAFAPLLTLGIPGGGTTAVLLGGLMMWGLRPGPLLFRENPDFVWGLISSMYIGNIICLIIAFASIPLMMKVVRVPASVMIPIISVVCVIGTYTVNNSLFDVYLMIVMGILSYFMGIAGIPAAPLLLTFVLTPMLEGYVRQAFDISRGSLSIFVGSNIARVLLALTIIFCLSPIVVNIMQKRKAKNGEAPA
ncbi:MAG: tripartite tricarboxylate transporter permease [Limnochordia bacterium]|jgi:putative tricarboxylic transport membrane protein